MTNSNNSYFDVLMCAINELRAACPYSLVLEDAYNTALQDVEDRMRRELSNNGLLKEGDS